VNPGRVLAIDLGDVRVGLALSDPLGLTAQPYETLERRGLRSDLARIVEHVRRHDVCRVIVGLPLLMSGEEGSRATGAREFAAKLAASLGSIPVEMWDERLTTVQAERALVTGDVSRRKRREVVDRLAAVLILQNWLDARSSV
jgi:putative Holliday junction resolvase